ncbi:hypothetical protein [Photobacterium leiognathi]|uniref:hypothetical protein n=1 Tax=Photobacterium leiognathi TaxID=553611 RepID=UPI0029822B1E|nr:hypothetical protein [Photobacterium leiognathi]
MENITSDELERRVDEVLFYHWDPIGINQYVNTRAEYRSYVPQILSMLEQGEMSEVIKLLSDLERSMSLEPNESTVRKIVDLLFSHKNAIEKGLA